MKKIVTFLDKRGEKSFLFLSDNNFVPFLEDVEINYSVFEQPKTSKKERKKVSK